MARLGGTPVAYCPAAASLVRLRETFLKLTSKSWAIMNIAVKNDVYRVFSAYRDGILRKAPPAVAEMGLEGLAPSPRRRLDFDQLARCACLGLSSPREQLTRRVISMAAYRGFLTARAGELMLAREHFAAAWELWRRLQEGFCQTCLVGLIEGYEAYLEYRLSDRSEAARRLERALDSSLLLEVRYGLTLFELHRMQLGHNLARIDWRFGFLEEAFALTGAMVGYLQGLRRDLPFHRDWRPSRMLSCPVYLRQAMMVQIAGEAIERLVARPETAHWETFLNEAMIDDDESGSRFFVDPRLWRWLLARRARLEGDRRRYLQTLEEILPAGPRGVGDLRRFHPGRFRRFLLRRALDRGPESRRLPLLATRPSGRTPPRRSPGAGPSRRSGMRPPSPTPIVAPPSRADERVVA